MKKIFVLIASIIILVSCGKQLNESEIITDELSKEIQKKTIYTSFYPIYFLTNSLIWDEATVINLVPAGWEPHEYEPTLKQIGEIQKSDLIILNWLWMESYEAKLIESIWTWKIVLLSEKLDNLIKLNKEEHEAEHENEAEHKTEDEHHWHDHWDTDPHTWLSPKEFKKMANILVSELENAWFNNLDKSVLDRLDDLENKYNLWIKECEVKKLVTSHEAFWYLASDYWLIQHPVFWISPEEEPSAKDITSVIDLIKNEKLDYIFSEEFVSPKFAETIKKETWVTVLTLHPLESLSSDEEIAKEDYISIMEKNLEKLRTWLKCK